MPKIPKQRGEGQTGGFGGQFINRGSSLNRGGRPSAGGGGQGPKPPRKLPCAIIIIAGFGGMILAGTSGFYLASQIFG